MQTNGAGDSVPLKRLTSWSPLRRPVYRALWMATLVSHIGTWMQNTASAWLMTSLAPSPLMVSLVQTATTLPLFLLALPAGALADVLDRRRLLLLTQSWMIVAAAALGWLTVADAITPWLLLSFTLMLGIGAAMNAPAWQAIVPELVEMREIPAAVALNSAGFNVARSVGPALGGLVLGLFGAGVAFFINAFSFLGVLTVLFLWRQKPRESALPAERVISATRTGLRYVRHAPALQAVLIRTAAFIVSASAAMALLPLVAKDILALDSTGYGLLLGFFGLGAVVGAVLLQPIRRGISVDLLVMVGTMGFAGTLTTLALVRNCPAVCVALAVGGAAWLALISSFNSGVQAVVPSWVRGRALSVYMLVIFGGMAGGATLWGAVAVLLGLPRTLLTAAGSLVLAWTLTAAYSLAEDSLDLSPSGHWPSPSPAVEPRPEEGPVVITVEYLIDTGKSEQFVALMRARRNTRMRDGALSWGLYVDASRPERYVESFTVASWLEHLRQHQRVTVADRELEKKLYSFHTGKEAPVVTHFLSKTLPK